MRVTTMNVEKRGHVRVKVSVPIDLTPEGSETPLRTETADLSATGCYIETLFTLAVSTKLQITLYAGASTILTTAKIVTRDPNVGNGLEFTSLSEKDSEALRQFIAGVAAQQKRDCSADR
jgi:c-di-GMP-binding flagellar brake protein YcgR